jgi:hypothetical protein
MLDIMFDPRFKSMKLAAMFMGHQNATLVVIEYDEKLLMPLSMEANKFLIHDKVETTFDLHLEGDYESLLHTTSTSTNTYKDSVKGSCWVSSCKCVLSWWHKRRTQFSNHCSFHMSYFWHPS